MIGMNHGDFDVAGDCLRASLIHARHVLRAFCLQPSAHFRHATTRGWCCFDYFYRITHVVEVAMRTQQYVDSLDFLFRLRALRIVHDPWIDNEDFAGGSFNTECGVAQPRKFDAFKIHDLTVSPFFDFSFSRQHSGPSRGARSVPRAKLQSADCRVVEISVIAGFLPSLI